MFFIEVIRDSHLELFGPRRFADDLFEFHGSFAAINSEDDRNRELDLEVGSGMLLSERIGCDDSYLLAAYHSCLVAIAASIREHLYERDIRIHLFQF